MIPVWFPLGRFLFHFRFGLRFRLRLRLRLFHLYRLLVVGFGCWWLHRRGGGPVVERVARRLADLLLLLHRLLLHLLLLHLLLLASAARIGLARIVIRHFVQLRRALLHVGLHLFQQLALFGGQLSFGIELAAGRRFGRVCTPICRFSSSLM